MNNQTLLERLKMEFEPCIAKGLNESALPIIDASKMALSDHREEQTLILDYIFLVKTAFLSELTYALQAMSIGGLKMGTYIKKLEASEYIQTKQTKHGKAIILTPKAHALFKEASKENLRANSDDFVKDEILEKRKYMNKLLAFRTELMAILWIDTLFSREDEAFKQAYIEQNKDYYVELTRENATEMETLALCQRFLSEYIKSNRQKVLSILHQMLLNPSYNFLRNEQNKFYDRMFEYGGKTERLSDEHLLFLVQKKILKLQMIRRNLLRKSENIESEDAPNMAANLKKLDDLLVRFMQKEENLKKALSESVFGGFSDDGNIIWETALVTTEALKDRGVFVVNITPKKEQSSLVWGVLVKNAEEYPTIRLYKTLNFIEQYCSVATRFNYSAQIYVSSEHDAKIMKERLIELERMSKQFGLLYVLRPSLERLRIVVLP